MALNTSLTTFQYNSPGYIPSVDLNVLNNSFNTLEQGHKEAVQAASELETAMANLDLNEAESEWRWNKINEIKQTVADNTVYGNSYAALDNLIMKAGDLASDPGMIGRLQAQKDFKAYQTQVNEDKTLPQDYKDYYLAVNPYHYEDKVDKDGNIIGGSKWTPVDTPTPVVDATDMLVDAIKIAAEDAGGNSVSRWIDINGNVTTDPSRAYDGEIFDQTDMTWKRLGEDKIWKALQTVIATRNGAKESLAQDYKIAKWKHDNAVSENNGTAVVDDITDANGVLLTPNQYIMKRFQPGIQAASYNNAVVKTNYGAGLSSYLKTSRTPQYGSGDYQDMFNINDLITSSRGTPVEMDINTGAQLTITKNEALSGIKNIIENITGEEMTIKDGQTIDNFESLLGDANIDPDQRQQLGAYILAYNNATRNLNAIRDQLSDADKVTFDFSSRMESGSGLIASSEGGSKYDDKIINWINELYGSGGDSIVITLDDKTNNILKLNEQDLLNLGIIKRGTKITIPKTAINSLPMVASKINEARKQSNIGLWPTIGQWVARMYVSSKAGSRLTVDVLDSDGNVISQDVRDDQNVKQNSNTFLNIVKQYDRGINRAKKIMDDKTDINSKITLSNLNLNGESFTDAILLDRYNKGLLTAEQYNKQKSFYSDSFEKIFANADFSQMEMYILDKNGTALTKVEDSGDRFSYGNDIRIAFANNRVTITPTFVPGSNDAVTGAPLVGYNILVTPKVDTDGKPKGSVKQFYIPGLINEEASKMILSSPSVQAYNDVSLAGAQHISIYMTDSISYPTLRNSIIQGIGDGFYNIEFAGVQNTVGIKDASDYSQAIENYKACKNAYIVNGGLNEAMSSTMENSAIMIGNIFNINPNNVLNLLYQDMGIDSQAFEAEAE